MIDYTRFNDRTINLLKAVRFDYPDWTPCHVELLPATWIRYREALEEVVLGHPKVFPHFREGSREFDRIDDQLYETGDRTDNWGVGWKNYRRGLDSKPVVFPLEDWNRLDEYEPPDPQTDDLFGKRQWSRLSRRFEESKKNGDLAVADELPHGFLFMRLAYLRGFTNLMSDFAVAHRRLQRLIRMVEDYDRAVIEECVRLGAEYIRVGDDFGMENMLMISPSMWRTFLKPSYERILRPCRDAAIPIHFHSDGHILEIIPDLVEIGVGVLNLQYTANGLAGLQEVARGTVALDVDLDRQLFPFASPGEIESHVREVFEGLTLPHGGLMLHAECGPGVPLASIDALCCSLERICGLPIPRLLPRRDEP